jgi:hypothetical protein
VCCADLHRHVYGQGGKGRQGTVTLTDLSADVFGLAVCAGWCGKWQVLGVLGDGCSGE